MTATVITGGRALVGERLDVLEDPAILVEDSRIVSIAPRTGVHPVHARHIHCDGMTLLPGFIDAHVHIGFAKPHDVLVRGITTARDLACPPGVIFPLKEASSEIGFDGPRVLAAGQMLTAPKGYPMRAGWAPPGTGLEVKGPEDAAEAVARQADAGADVIKVALNPPVGPTLDLATLKAIVAAAHSRGLRTTGHVYGVAELEKALSAGLDELAHMLMSPEIIPGPVLETMVAQGMRVVPTLSVRFGRDRKKAIANVQAFVAAGGTVIYGTDLGNAGPKPGIDRREVKAMSSAGLSGADIIRSATVDAAGWLRLTDTGVLSAGAAADVIAVMGDPLADPLSLADARFVMRAGVAVRFPP